MTRFSGIKVQKLQVWYCPYNKLKVQVVGPVGGHKWRTRILTAKRGVYNGTHTLSEKTLAKQYQLLS